MSDRDAALQLLIDRQEILDCLNRYCRALDRHDDELLTSVFHPDAVDNHGPWAGGREPASPPSAPSFPFTAAGRAPCWNPG